MDIHTVVGVSSALFIGVVAGLFPLIYAKRHNYSQMGWISFFLCTLGGLLRGYLLASLIAIYCLYTIYRKVKASQSDNERNK